MPLIARILVLSAATLSLSPPLTGLERQRHGSCGKDVELDSVADPRPEVASLLRTEGVVRTGAEVSPLLSAPTRHVRAIGESLQALLHSAAHRSPTIVRMLTALQATDVIVLIVDSPHLAASIPARLLIVTKVEGFRYLRIEVGRRRGGDDLIALLGHELYHAVEIANAPEVQDVRSLSMFYRRVGFGTQREEQFDTEPAHVIERRVRQELGRSC